MAAAEADVAAKLIERLLVDPAFRARFRRNPAEACREAGLDELAQEMQLGAGKAMMTLDMRESKSSLAGVMMAAAMEGVGIMQFAEHVAPHLDDIPEAIGDVLSRVNLPGHRQPRRQPVGAARPVRRRRRPAPAGPTVPTRSPASTRAPRAATAPRRPPPRSRVGAGDAPVAAGDPAAARGRQGRRRSGGRGRPRRREAEVGRGRGGREDHQAGVAGDQGGGGGAEERRRRSRRTRRTSPARPTSRTSRACRRRPSTWATRSLRARRRPAPRQPPRRSGRRRGSCRRPAPRRPRRRPPRPPVEPQPAASGTSAADLADQPAGGGAKHHAGRPSRVRPGRARRHALGRGRGAAQEQERRRFDPDGIADIKAGKIDPRVIAAVTKIAEDHKLKITCMCSDHPKFTSGGSVSNHAYGRGLDIGSVDGEIVNPGSGAARELASELSQLPEQYRPDEIGSPWPISGPGYFTDGAHQDHLHLGFKKEIDPSWSPPGDVAAKGARRPRSLRRRGRGARRAGAAAAPPPSRLPPPRRRRRRRRRGAAARAEGGRVGPVHGGGRRSVGGRRRRAAPASFLAAQPPAGPPSAVASAASVPGMVDAAAAAAPGSGASSVGAAALKVAQTQLGVHEQGVNTGERGRQVPRGREGRPRQPVVRELRDVVARAVGPQDERQRLGRGADLGPARRGEARTTCRSSAPTRRARATSSPTTGATGTTSAPTATSASSPATSRTASSPRSRATTRTRS